MWRTSESDGRIPPEGGGGECAAQGGRDACRCALPEVQQPSVRLDGERGELSDGGVCLLRIQLVRCMTLALPYAMSAVTLAAIYFAGEKKPWAWLLSLGNQALWAAWIYLTWPQASGLVPMCLCLTVLYARNFQKWRAPHTQSGYERTRLGFDVRGVEMNAGE